MRKFCHPEPGGDVPDATTIGRCRQKLAKHDLWEVLPGEVNRQLEARHIIMTEGRETPKSPPPDLVASALLQLTKPVTGWRAHGTWRLPGT